MKKKILIVDDDEIILFLHQAILEDVFEGKSINMASNGQIAYEYILENDDSEILIFLDINMPKMNGWELLELLTLLNRHLPIVVVMVTSSVNKSDMLRAEDYFLVKGFLTKPMKVSDVENLCQKNAFIQHYR